VIGLITAHSLHRSKEDTITRNRKRLKPTSTNARITRPVFGDLYRKQLAIPRIIDDYNHHINGIDLANQLRAWMTCSRPGIYKAWHPLWYWLLDTCACNAYLIWKASHIELDPGSSRLHRRFQEALIRALLETPNEGLAAVAYPMQTSLAAGHTRSKMPRVLQCRQCLQRGKDERNIRRFGTELVNGVTPRRAPNSTYGCTKCRANLCKEGPCWDLYHAIDSRIEP
jgi:hypothetical protein